MKRTFFTLTITPLILSVFVPNVYAHTAIYKYGCENGKIDGALGQLLDGDASGVCDKYSSSKQTETGVQYDKCAEGYSDGYNHFYGKSLKIFAKIDHVPAKPEYKYGYKFVRIRRCPPTLSIRLSATCITPHNRSASASKDISIMLP